MMKTILKLEELGMFLASLVLLYVSHASWWWYLLMFLGPDISMLGYLVNNKIGAWSYNLVHHKGIALLIFGIGLAFQLPGDIENKDWLINIGIVLFGHASMDRVAGYGLKYENGFKFTHLGEIGKK
jgi:predicted Kef-type K+ transport protein